MRSVINTAEGKQSLCKWRQFERRKKHRLVKKILPTLYGLLKLYRRNGKFEAKQWIQQPQQFRFGSFKSLVSVVK